MIGGGRLLLRENLADTDPPRCKAPIFNLFSLVVPRRNTINTNIGSPATIRTFQ